MIDNGRQTTDDGGRATPGTVQHPGSSIRHPSPDIAVATACGVFVAFMVGMAYAAVPLYSWFCRTTGFGGVPQIVSVAPAQISDRKIAVRFDTNVSAGLPWRFGPGRTPIRGQLGEGGAGSFTVANLSGRENP